MSLLKYVGELHICPELISLLFQEYIPDLYNHFLDISLEAHMYASQWFLTLFTAKFPLYMVFHIIDLLLCEVGVSLYTSAVSLSFWFWDRQIWAEVTLPEASVLLTLFTEVLC